MEINWADKWSLNTWVIYLLLVLVWLLISAKIPQCPAHMCGTLCTHLAARQTPPLATVLWSFKHTYTFVSQQQHRKEQPTVYCTDSLAGLLVNNVLSAGGVWQTCEQMNVGQAKIGLRRCMKQKGQGRVRETWAAVTKRLPSEVLFARGRWFVREIFFSLTFPLLKQTLLKRTPALIVHGKVPWNVGPSLWNV